MHPVVYNSSCGQSRICIFFGTRCTKGRYIHLAGGHESTVKGNNAWKGLMTMKKTLLILACAAVAPLAFAQTATTDTTKTTTTEPATVTTETQDHHPQERNGYQY